MLQLPSRPIDYIRLVVGLAIISLFMLVQMGNYFQKGQVQKQARLTWDIGTFVRMTPSIDRLVVDALDANPEDGEIAPPQLFKGLPTAPSTTMDSRLAVRFDENLVWALHFFGRNTLNEYTAGVPATWDAKLGGVYQFGGRKISIDHRTNVSYLLALEILSAQNRKYGAGDDEFPLMLDQEIARMKNVVIDLFENPEPVAQNYDGDWVFDIVLDLIKLAQLTQDDDYVKYAISFFEPYSERIRSDLPLLQKMQEAQYVIPNWVGLAGAKMLIANQLNDDEMFAEGLAVLKQMLRWGAVPQTGTEFNPVKTAFYFKTIRGNKAFLEIESNRGYNVDPELWAETNLFISHALLELAKISTDPELVQRGRDILLNAYYGPEAGYHFRLWDDRTYPMTDPSTGEELSVQYGGFFTKYDVKREELIGDTKFVEPLFYALSALNSYSLLYPRGDSGENFKHPLDIRSLSDLTYQFIRTRAYQSEYNGFFMEMDQKWEKPEPPPFTEAQGRYVVYAAGTAFGLVPIFTYQTLPGSSD